MLTLLLLSHVDKIVLMTKVPHFFVCPNQGDKAQSIQGPIDLEIAYIQSTGRDYQSLMPVAM